MVPQRTLLQPSSPPKFHVTHLLLFHNASCHAVDPPFEKDTATNAGKVPWGRCRPIPRQQFSQRLAVFPARRRSHLPSLRRIPLRQAALGTGAGQRLTPPAAAALMAPPPTTPRASSTSRPMPRLISGSVCPRRRRSKYASAADNYSPQVNPRGRCPRYIQPPRSSSACSPKPSSRITDGRSEP